MKVIWCVILSMLLSTWAEKHEADTEPRFIGLIIALIASAVSATVAAVSRRTIDNYSLLNREQEMFEQLIIISSKITELENNIKESPDITITKILQTFPKTAKMELSMNELKLIIDQINFAGEQMQSYLYSGYNKMKSKKQNTTSSDVPDQSSQKDINIVDISTPKTITPNNTNLRNADVDTRLERYTLDNFAAWATDHGFNSLRSLLRRMHDLIAPKDDDGIFSLILQVSEETHHTSCNLKQSVHQTLYNLYNSILIAQVKGNAIIQFSYSILQINDKGVFTEESKITLDNFKRYLKKEAEVVRKVLSVADRTMYKCDPVQYIDGVTHTKLTRLLQGYIENEMNLNSNGACWETCEDYRETKYYGCSENKLCAYQPQCKGKIVDCRYVQPNMEICMSSNPDRRYDWIEYENGKILGNKGMCERENLYDVRSWTSRFSFRCAYCLCLCDDVGKESDRYFNLREVTSDIEENKVVTGLRIVKQNQIVHLQIQQGILNEFGVINGTTLSWKPVDNYSIYDNDVINNVDYFTMELRKRAIDTNEMTGPPKHVVTGVRLRKIGNHLNLDVRVTPINFTSGKVYKEDHSYWLGNDNAHVNLSQPRTKIELIDPDIPTRKGPHTLISKPNEYIQFQQTSFETDAGQSTVPFLDLQELTSQGFPISGVGLIHRGKRGSGGFLGPKLITYDFTPHIGFNKTH